MKFYNRRGSKYGNKKTAMSGSKMDSGMEASYYQHLLVMQAKGIVDSIELQPKFTIHDAYMKGTKKVQAITYVADFLVTYADGRKELIDVKGAKTEVFKIKRKLYDARYPELPLRCYQYKNYQWIEV